MKPYLLQCFPDGLSPLGPPRRHGDPRQTCNIILQWYICAPIYPCSQTLVPFHCSRHQPSPVSSIPRSHSPLPTPPLPPNLSSQYIPPSQSRSSSSPSTLHSKRMRFLHQPFPFHPFLVRLSLTPTSSFSSAIMWNTKHKAR